MMVTAIVITLGTILGGIWACERRLRRRRERAQKFEDKWLNRKGDNA